MPRVIAQPDNLDELNSDFVQSPLNNGVFLNSVPKSGSHLLKNIVRMFVPVEQQYNADFIQFPTLQKHQHAFKSQEPKLSWGHLLFGDHPAVLLKDTHHILLVRDPYDWVLARTRFFLSENFQANLEHIKYGKTDIGEFMNMMIFGVFNLFPTMKEIYDHNSVAWLGTNAKVVKYEDLLAAVKDLDSKMAQTFFQSLFSDMGIELPGDWKERVLIGSDRKQSGTARENLDLRGVEVPKTLPQAQKDLVDYTCPGLRQVLGYN